MKAKSLVVAGAALAACTFNAQAAADWPAPVRALESRGMAILGRFAAPAGMTGYAGAVRGEPVAIYVTADGNHAVIGPMIDAKGTNLTEGPLQKAAGAKLGDLTWKKLESSAWVRDGRADAPRVVYAFTDPNCPYCNRFWNDARPWVDSGKVQLRHVMVGILAQSSSAKAAAILGAKDPSAALTRNERDHASGGIEPVSTIEPAVGNKLMSNEATMRELGTFATPTIYYRDAQGMVRKAEGAPGPQQLAEILGPR